MTIYL